MNKFVLALAAAAALGLAAPTFANAAQTSTTTVVKPAGHVVVTKKVRDFSAGRHHCRVVIVKKHRGHRVIVTKVRRCW